MKIIMPSALCALALLTACTSPAAPSDQFFDRLTALCGKSFAGQLVSDDAVDADFKRKAMVMQVRDCSDGEIRIPFHVDDDRSRTWVVTKTDTGLRLKHDHRHKDGSEDAVTQYGGDTATPGTASRQAFPVDEFSIAMFNREGLTASVVNVWSVEVTDTQYVYELSRPGRLFRVEFDTTAEVPAPPPPW